MTDQFNIDQLRRAKKILEDKEVPDDVDFTAVRCPFCDAPWDRYAFSYCLNCGVIDGA